jgi:CheY-specific phosphatase CheX
VAEEGFFASVEPVGDDEWGELCVGHDTWLESQVRFHGPIGGALRCRLPLGLAKELVSAFLGMEIGDLGPKDPLVEDLTGELANMLCGRWLTRTQSGQVFDLEHPVVGVAPEGGCEAWRRYAANGVPLAVELTLEA